MSKRKSFTERVAQWRRSFDDDAEVDGVPPSSDEQVLRQVAYGLLTDLWENEEWYPKAVQASDEDYEKVLDDFIDWYAGGKA